MHARTLVHARTSAVRPVSHVTCDLRRENFLLSHSTAYQAMVLLCWAEYWLEYIYVDAADRCPAALPACKQWGPINTLGLAICAVGCAAAWQLPPPPVSSRHARL